VSRLESNLRALAARFPGLADEIAEAPEARLEIVRAASGEASARVPEGPWLHSSRDPRAEAARVASSLLEGGADTVVALGFGLGYLPEACLEAGAERVIACEASAGALKAALGARDLEALLGDERLGFVVGRDPELAITALEASGASRAAVSEPKAASGPDGEWLARARAAAGRWIAKSRINERTLARFGRLWVRNLAANLEASAGACGVDRLEGLFRGLPALVLAAGPSLDEILPSLGELSRRALVVCVDTALRSALRAGTAPDFIVVADPQYWNWRHVAGLAAPSSILVSDATTWPAVFRMPRRGTFLAGSLFPLGQRIERFAGRKGKLGAGGSVATCAWDLARLAGCAPIWMAGLDLGFPGGATHARASLFEQRALASGRRLSPAQSAQAAALLGADGFAARAADGGSVRSDRRMELYAWWFESRLSRPGAPATVSLSPRGLAIPGMGLGRIEELLAGPDIREEIDARLSEAESMRPPADARAVLGEGLEGLRREIGAVLAAAEAAEEAARAGREALARGADAAPVLAELDRADRRLLSLEGREVAGFLLPPLAELAGSRAGGLDESLALSGSLYRSVAESARYHLEVLSGRGPEPRNSP
jgi:hypothetical protein